MKLRYVLPFLLLAAAALAAAPPDLYYQLGRLDAQIEALAQRHRELVAQRQQLIVQIQQLAGGDAPTTPTQSLDAASTATLKKKETPQ